MSHGSALSSSSEKAARVHREAWGTIPPHQFQTKDVCLLEQHILSMWGQLKTFAQYFMVYEKIIVQLC